MDDNTIDTSTKVNADVEHGRKTSNMSLRNEHQIKIICRNVHFSVPQRNARTKRSKWRRGITEHKTIINGVTATFRPGRLTAVMGASGAGKTSLLSLLAGDLRKQGTILGHVQVNGEAISLDSRRMRDISGFVFQEDVILETMTVREAITMSATLRLPDSVTHGERVGELIQLLNLECCADTRVGDTIKKGISGGERKRTSIAMELITNPPVLFLDEPTSGLDTQNAFSVVKILQELAHEHGRTVIATIHQPSSQIFHLFDDLLLMAQGQVLYYGPASDAVAYFAERGFVCPQYTNPSDYFFMHVVSQPSTLLVQWKESKEYSKLQEESSCGGVPREALHQHASFLSQFKYLMSRAGKNAWRNRMIIQAKLGQNALVGLLVGLIYYNTDDKSIAIQIQDRNGALYFMIVSQFFGSAMGFVSVFSGEKAVFLREYSAGYYSLLPYYLSKTLMEFPVQIISPVMFIAISYYLIGLRKDANHLFTAALTCVMTALTGMAVGTVAGAAFDGIGMALAVLPLLLLPLLMFSGLIINMGSIPIYFRWIKHLSPMKYGYEALMKNEYAGMLFDKCDPTKEPCTGEQVLQAMSMGDGLSAHGCVGVLFAIYSALMIIAFFALLRVAMKIRY